MNLTYTEMLDTFSALGKSSKYIEEMWPKTEKFFTNKKRFVFIGCGSSYSMAKSMSTIAYMNTGLPSCALAAGDVLLHAERYAKCFDGAAVVCISRSGKTSELLMALDTLKARFSSFTVASLVCADNTPLAEKSELVLSMPWAFDESVCQTRCVTNFYFSGAFIFCKLAGNKAVLDDLQSVIENGSAFMKKAENLADELADRPWNHSVVLADAELEGLAEEGALVFKEVCQLPSNYYHLMDLRHGPMVLLGEKTLVIAALGAKNKLEYDLLSDVKKKNAQLVTFSDVQPELNTAEYSIVYGTPLSHIALGIPLIILCQMIAYKKSKITGADPDKPTGLDAWIKL